MRRYWLLPVVAVVLGAFAIVLMRNPVKIDASSEPMVETPVPTAEPLRPVETPISTATPRRGAKPDTDDTKRVRQASRGFLKDFLPYSYGNGNPDFSDATPEFRADLLERLPDVPERIRKLSARVTLLQVDGPSEDGGYKVGAMVKDTQGARYPITMVVGLHEGDYKVYAIGG